MADINPDFNYVSQSKQDLGGIFAEKNSLGNAYSKENESGNLNIITDINSKSYNQTLKDIYKETTKGNEMQKSNAMEMDNQVNTPRDLKGEAKQKTNAENKNYSPQALEQTAGENSRKTTVAEQQSPEVNERGEGKMVVNEPQKTEEDSVKSRFMDWFVGKVIDSITEDNDNSPDNQKPDNNTKIDSDPKNERQLESENYKQPKLNQKEPANVNPDMPNPGTAYFDRPTPSSPPPGPEPTFPTMKTRGPAANAPLPQFGGTKVPKPPIPSFKFGR